MKALAIAGAAALVAATTAPAAKPSVTIPLCSGTGETRQLTIPLDPAAPPPANGENHCLKACHAVGSRKRAFAIF